MVQSMTRTSQFACSEQLHSRSKAKTVQFTCAEQLGQPQHRHGRRRFSVTAASATSAQVTASATPVGFYCNQCMDMMPLLAGMQSLTAGFHFNQSIEEVYFIRARFRSSCQLTCRASYLATFCRLAPEAWLSTELAEAALTLVLAKYSPFPVDSLGIVKVLAAARRTRAGTLETLSRSAGVVAVVGWTARRPWLTWAATPTARWASWTTIVQAALEMPETVAL